MKTIRKSFLIQFLSIFLLASTNHLLGLSYTVYDLGLGRTNFTPWMWGVEAGEFLLNNADEALKYDELEDEARTDDGEPIPTLVFSLFSKDKRVRQFTIPELKDKIVEIYTFRNGTIMGTFYCDKHCSIHVDGERHYYRQHLFIYNYNTNKFVDLRLEAAKAGFQLYPLDDDWAYEIAVNDRGMVAGKFVVDGLVHYNWEYRIFYYHPDYGMKKIEVEGLPPETNYSFWHMNNQGQILFSTELFDEIKHEYINRAVYLYDPNKGIIKLDDLNPYLEAGERYYIEGLSENGDILLELEQTRNDKLFIYNVNTRSITQISEGDSRLRAIPSNYFTTRFNRKNQIAFHKNEEQGETEINSLIFWDSKSGLTTFNLPNFNYYITWHGMDNQGRILGTHEFKAFIWNNKNGIQWLDDLIKSKRNLHYQPEEMIMNQNGTILAETESDDVDETHCILLIPKQ